MLKRFAIWMAIAAGLAVPAAADAPKLTGDWQSVAPEAQGPMFVTRTFHFEGNTWSVVYRAFGDADAKAPLFTLDVGGVFVVGGPAALPGAYNGIFPATRRDITAESTAGAALFAGMGCTLEVGTAKSLVSDACGFVPPLMQAMGEYDLVKINNGQLFFGERSGDLTKARPTALYPFPLAQK